MVKSNELLLYVIDSDELQLLYNQKNKNRFGKISAGARSIMTQWPNFLSTCWLTSLVSIIIVFLLTIILLTTINTQMALQLSQCNQYEIGNNQSIYLVHDLNVWQDKQIEVLRKIIENYPNYQINIIQIVKNHHQHINSSRIINDLATIEQNVVIKKLKYKEIFNNTPVFWRWLNLSITEKNFLVRVLELWKSGGLSFDMDLMTNSTRNLDQLLSEIRGNYEDLQDNQIIIDKNGLYFGSKIPCHIVYGRILMLTKQIGYFNVDNLLKQTMVEFCNTHIIKNNIYCSRN